MGAVGDADFERRLRALARARAHGMHAGDDADRAVDLLCRRLPHLREIEGIRRALELGRRTIRPVTSSAP